MLLSDLLKVTIGGRAWRQPSCKILAPNHYAKIPKPSSRIGYFAVDPQMGPYFAIWFNNILRYKIVGSPHPSPTLFSTYRSPLSVA